MGLREGVISVNRTELRRYEKLLLEKQSTLRNGNPDGKAPVPAAGGPQGDLVDQANADYEAELQIRLRRTDGRLLRAIEEALTRIKDGTFGICTVCGQPISKARLKAVPWTRLCLECKEKQAS